MEDKNIASFGAEGTRGRLDIHPVVFWVSAATIVAFVVVTVANTERMGAVFDATQNLIATSFGWFYVLVVNVFLILVAWLLFSRFASLRLGGPEERPEFSLWAWFAMLFAAGMGIGLMFYSVAEPMYHFAAPPTGEGGTAQAAELAMAITYFHWGLHAWGIYALVGLTLAFFSFNKGLPLTIRSGFYPLLGERVYGPIGNVIDILAVVSTLFGVATSLGLGARQVNAGLNHVFGVPQGIGVEVVLIAIIAAIALTSVVLGLDRGIRRLSLFNMYVAGALLAFVFILGPSVFLLDSVIQNLGGYIQRLPELSTWTEVYEGGDWQASWTIFYWGWWIAWSPFVGMFIARVSRGRTLREFIAGVLLVPTIVTFIWVSIFGGAALYEELVGAGGIVEAVNADVAVALFALLERFPWAMLTSVLAMVVVVVFFVTSSDSASLVISILAAGGKPDTAVAQRIFWATLQGVVAAVLLVGGGLEALQTAAITTGLPFALVLLVMSVSLVKGLQAEMPLPDKPQLFENK